MPQFKLPDVGEGLTEAEIVTWKVKVGDVIEVNDVVVEIETAKSLVELPSPYAGTVQALHVPEGETVAVGTPIISVGAADEASSGASSQPAPPDASAEIDPSNPAASGGENQTLVGYGPRAEAVARRPRRGAAAPSSPAGEATQRQLQGAFGQGEPEPADVAGDQAADDIADIADIAADVAEEPAVPASPPPNARSEESSGPAEPADVRVLAKPPVRKLAKDLGVDLRSLVPSGPGGTVTRADVESAGRAPAAQSDGGAPSEPAPAAAASSRSDRERRQPIKGVRKMMAQAMVDSAFTAPHVTEWVTVDVTRTMRLVERLKADRDFRDVKVSPLLVLAKALCLAVRRTPEVNATWDEATQEVVLKSYVNLGIAAATPRGLVVPNVKDADTLSLAELGAAINELTRTAREGRTQPAEMADGSITITNVGVFGVDAGTPILNPGESAILCFGAVRQQPWVHHKKGKNGKKGKGKVAVRDVTTLALSFDHRIVDGEKGSRFLADVATVLEDPARALLL